MLKIKVIRKEGGSRILAVTDILPLDWSLVSIGVIKETKKCVTLKINKVK